VVITIISFIVRFIMMFGVMLTSFYVFVKAITYTLTKERGILSLSWCLLWAFLYAYSIIPVQLVRFLACAATIIFLYFLNKETIEANISAYMLSYGISIVLYYMSGLFLSVPCSYFINIEQVVDAPLDYTQPIYILIFVLIAVLQFTLAVLIFRIKRFKNGFYFIFKRYTIVVALVITGGVLMLVSWVNTIAKVEHHNSTDVFSGILYVTGILIIGIGLYIFLYRVIKFYQKLRIRQHSEAQFEKLYIKEKDEHEQTKKELEDLIKANSSALHSIEDRLRAFKAALDRGIATQEDFASLDSAWENELEKFNSRKNLKKTRVSSLDILFDYYSDQFAKDDIVFELIIDCNVKYMTENAVNKNHLETLISTHLNDAKIAVDASKSLYRRITAILRFADDHYEFSVLDSGISFEIDTLVRLGTERVTTHADTGGSGIGFETTFEIMREYNASLIVSEQGESCVDFSKSVSISFDGNAQYIIETYRPDDFPKSDRYTVKSAAKA
jgi:signal transduction histidine kinase